MNKNNEIDAEKFFWDSINMCYKINLPDKILFVYDDNYIRFKKLNKLNNTNNQYKLKNTNYSILFELEFNYNTLWIDMIILGKMIVLLKANAHYESLEFIKKIFKKSVNNQTSNIAKLYMNYYLLNYEHMISEIGISSHNLNKTYSNVKHLLINYNITYD